MRALKSFSLAIVFSASLPVQAQVIDVNYGWFRIQLNCETKSAEGWQYTAVKDTNNYPRHERFYHDSTIPNRCQQTSQGTYKSRGQVSYDRGHLVPANAMDSHEEAIRLSNMMVNVLPQVKEMNRGAWLETERYVECRRDHSPVSVWGGVYTGTIPLGGDFTVSHGVVAPEAFYKIAMHGNQIIAWWIPNSPEAVKSRVDDYIVTVADLENRLGLEFPIPSYLKNQRQQRTNAVTPNCDLS
ncbi:DNA/RNA non-specific endonuclease [Vibrio agarivorans]|uniref:DNA/RNA non-specific endonuclease n=1 Tax=Vibrio agarivorans TaxID=153622 RepID=UPI0025B4F43D|nr:DNA/RNA non-specific endonuclease [Vibrio agarivorans]MDN3661051.1 DNA/RNA non-specific endonuclease [Vibrio agarivorans]